MTSKMFLEQGEARAYEPECMVSAGIYCKQGRHSDRCVSRSSSSASTASLSNAKCQFGLITDWLSTCSDTASLNMELFPSWHHYQSQDRLFNVGPLSRPSSRTAAGSTGSHGSCWVSGPPPRRIFKLPLPSWFMAKSCRFLGISSTTPLVCGTTVGHAPEHTSSYVAAGSPAVPCPGHPAVSGVSVHLPGRLETRDKTFGLPR